MPIINQFKPTGVIMWHRGVVTDEELIAANAEVCAHPDCADFHFQLINLLEVTEFNATPHGMQQLALMDRQVVRNRQQFACVVAPDDLSFGMSRIWNAHADENEFRAHVVRSLEEAVNWFAKNGIEVEITGC